MSSFTNIYSFVSYMVSKSTFTEVCESISRNIFVKMKIKFHVVAKLYIKFSSPVFCGSSCRGGRKSVDLWRTCVCTVCFFHWFMTQRWSQLILAVWGEWLVARTCTARHSIDLHVSVVYARLCAGLVHYYYYPHMPIGMLGIYRLLSVCPQNFGNGYLQRGLA